MTFNTWLPAALIRAVSILSPSAETAEESSAPSSPSIVILDIDIIRADALPCYGYSRDTAPNLCGFASSAVVFERNFSTSFWTLPAVVSTLTSQFPSRHGLFVTPKGAKLSGLSAGHLAKGASTLPRILRAHGYSTYFVAQDNTRLINAKTGMRPEFGRFIDSKGIESWLSDFRDIEAQGSPFLVYFYSRGVLFPYSADNRGRPLPGDLGQWANSHASPPAGFPTTRAALDAASAKPVAARPEHYFSAWAMERRPELFAGPKPGDPLEIFAFLQSIRAEFNPPYRGRAFDAVWSVWRGLPAGGDESARAYARLQYDTKVRHLDRLLAPLLDHLSGPRAEDTIVVITSDHGEFFGEHGLVGHQGALFQEVIHTPLIVRVPGIGPGRIREITQPIDILPTLLDAAGIRRLEAAQGISLLPWMRQGHGATERFAISEMGLTAACIQDRNWKLIVDRGRGWSTPRGLYHLEADARDHSNLIAREPARAERLRRVLDETLGDPAKWQTEPGKRRRRIDDETMERAQRRGYF